MLFKTIVSQASIYVLDRRGYSATAHILRTKKAPILRSGLSKFGRHKQTRTADLYHVKVGRRIF